jgi:dynein intermediate chain 1
MAVAAGLFVFHHHTWPGGIKITDTPCSCSAAVTALDFSQRNPHILGVGTHDGTIAVYDVRLRQPTPLMASTADTGKHSDPVWKVRTCESVSSVSVVL